VFGVFGHIQRCVHDGVTGRGDGRQIEKSGSQRQRAKGRDLAGMIGNPNSMRFIFKTARYNPVRIVWTHPTIQQ
jgi:hypothetical protein